MRSPCTSILSRVVVCGSGAGPEATSAATAPAGTPRARLVSRVAAVMDCGDLVFGTACLRLLMWDMGVFVDCGRRACTHARWRQRASGTSWRAFAGGLGALWSRRCQRRRASFGADVAPGRVAECAYSTANENYSQYLFEAAPIRRTVCALTCRRASTPRRPRP